MLSQLRSFVEKFITYGMNAHFPVLGCKWTFISRMAGTSVTQIENTYIHADNEMDVMATTG